MRKSLSLTLIGVLALSGLIISRPSIAYSAELEIKWLEKSYDYIRMYSEGLAAVELNGKYGFIDKTGKEVVALKYDYVSEFKEGIANVSFNGKYGYIDKTGKEVGKIKYDSAGYFSEGLGEVEVDGKWGFINKAGKEVIPLKYDKVFNFSDGLAMVGQGEGKWYVYSPYCVA